MPLTTPAIKVEAVRALGGEIVLAGENYDAAYEEAQRLVRETGKTFVHPFDDPDVIAGQGTIGVEILRQYLGTRQDSPDAVRLLQLVIQFLAKLPITKEVMERTEIGKSVNFLKKSDDPAIQQSSDRGQGR